jgi:hypothetical protein
MTGTRDTQQDGSIQAMLRDSGFEAATELRNSLEQLRALVPDEAPAPRADLAALLAPGASGPVRPVPLTTTALPTVTSATDSADESLPAGVTSLAERRGRKRRLAIVGGAVVGAMTLGAGAVAASSEDFRHGVSHTVGVIFQPSGQSREVAPKPAQPSPADLPATPVRSETAHATTPPAPGTAPAEPGSAAAVHAEPTPGATPPAVGRGGVLPTPPHRPVTPGMPALPGRGGDRSLPAEPLPAPTLPDVIPTLPGHP